MRHVLLITVSIIHHLTSLVSSSEFDFTVEVNPGKVECFFQPVVDPRHVTMEVDYQVIDGGDLDINFLVSNPTNQVSVQDIRKMDGSHKLDVSQVKGDYQFCFDNTFSYQNYKLVFFEIFLSDKDGSSDDKGNLDFMGAPAAAPLNPSDAELGMTVDNFRESSQRIKNQLNMIEHVQSRLGAFESRDRAVMEGNLSRVNFWSIMNAGILLAVGMLQVYMIRQMFEDNSKVGRLLRQRT